MHIQCITPERNLFSHCIEAPQNNAACSKDVWQIRVKLVILLKFFSSFPIKRRRCYLNPNNLSYSLLSPKLPSSYLSVTTGSFTLLSLSLCISLHLSLSVICKCMYIDPLTLWVV